MRSKYPTHRVLSVYSGTLAYGYCGHLANTFTFVCKIPEMRKLVCSIKQTSSPVLIVPDLYKIHFTIQMLIYHFHKIVQHLHWVQRPGIIYWHCYSSFLSIVQQQRDLIMQLRCAHQPEYTLPHLPEVYQKPPNYRYLHTLDTNSVCFRVGCTEAG